MNRQVSCGLALALLLGASPSTASDVSECRVDIAKASTDIARAYHVNVNDCLKFANYTSCDFDYQFGDVLDALSTAIHADNSDCTAALGGGATIGDIWPSTCSGNPFFDEYYNGYGCDFPVTDTDELEQCVACQSQRLGDRYRFALDLPTHEPETLNDRRCIRSVTSALSKSLRTAITAARRCAEDSGDPPWSCTLDLSADSKFSKTLGSLARKAAKCEDAAGVVGALSPGSMELCNTALASATELGACLQQVATCEACMTINVALGENLDCATIADDVDCRMDAVKPGQGSFVVANRDDSTVSYYENDGTPSAGTLAASTFATGTSPMDVLVSEKTNTVFSVSTVDETVTGLHARTGVPIHGTVGASSVSVGADPVALAINPEFDLLYVANSGDNTVTFLDADDLSYAFGTKVASTFSVGAEPSALAVTPDGLILYVANAGGGTVSYLDAATGQPLFGTLATSSFAVGPEPRALTLSSSGLLIADATDGVLRALAEDGTVATLDGSPTVVLGGQPIALASTGRVYAASATGTDLLTWSGDRGTEPVMAGGPVSDVAVGSSIVTYYFQDTPLLATLSESDEVVLSDTLNPISNAGVAPGDASTVSNPMNYQDWLYVPAHDRFYARTCDAFPDGHIGVVHPDTLATEQSFLVPGCANSLGYGPSGDVLYAASEGSNIVFLDATTGDGAFGTLANSTFPCGTCDIGSYIQIVVNEAANRLYLRCREHVAYMDATTGACLGGSEATTGLPGEIGNILLDDATGKLFLSADCQDNVGYQTIFELDPVLPQFLNGTRDNSKISSQPAICAEAPLQGNGNGTVYAFDSGGPMLTIDAATGNVLSSLGNFLFATRFEADPAHDLLRSHFPYSTFDKVIYQKLSDLSYPTGDLETSTLELPEFIWFAEFVPAPGADYSLVVGNGLISRIRRDSVAFMDNTRTLGGTVVPTGDHPSAVASMPELTGY